MPRAGSLEPDNVAIGGVLAGRYRVLERLGSGSTAVVYKVQDLLANDVVAVKILYPGVAADPAVVANFRRELATARKLTHPNLVSVYDLGLFEGLYYISMEYIDGYSLARRLAERGPLPLAEFLNVADVFCQALAWVHSRQIVHRDIKPSNLMFTSSGTLKLMDFGIAKELAADQSSSTRVGTPGYASPEQQAGLPLRPTSDIYSTGVMFFELVTGTRLSGEAVEGAFPAALRQAAPELPAIIARCMAPSQGDRFQTAEELRSALRKMGRNFVPVAHDRSPIRARMTEAPADARNLIPLFLQTVKRVQEIHASGLYHAELSPDSIWITSAGAVEIDSFDAPRSAGTLGLSAAKYLAPEVFSDVEESGAHSCPMRDAYVLGFVFYEMLLGRQAFDHQFPRGAENDRFWLTWHSDPSKSLQPATAVLPRCPKAFANLLQQITSKDRGARPGLDQVATVLGQLYLSIEDTAPILPPDLPKDAAEPGTPQPASEGHAATGSGAFRRWLGRIALAGAFLIAAATLIAAGMYVVRERNRTPASFRLEPDKLIVVDDRGAELWRKALDEPIDPDAYTVDGVAVRGRRVWFGDLDGDGHTEMLFLLKPRNVAHLTSLICLSDTGVERWRFVPGRTVATRGQAYPPPYRITEFLVAPIGPNRSLSVLVSSTHHRDFPNQVALLSPTGEMLGEYWHSGWISRMITADLDHNGVDEIYLGGMSAARKAATLVAISPDHFGGASVEQGAPDFQLQNLPPARELARVFFPRSCMNLKAGSPNRVVDLQADRGSISVSVQELLSAPQPVLLFRLGSDLSLLDLKPSATFQQTHTQMEKTGELDHPFSAEEEAALRRIEVVR